MQVIDRFDGEHRFLSNFFPASIVFGRIEYPTVEHAFQAAKTDERALKLAVAAAPSPGAAKRIGRKLPLRADWEQVKTDIMQTRFGSSSRRTRSCVSCCWQPEKSG